MSASSPRFRAYSGHAKKWDRVNVDGELSADDCAIRYLERGQTLAIAITIALRSWGFYPPEHPAVAEVVRGDSEPGPIRLGDALEKLYPLYEELALEVSAAFRAGSVLRTPALADTLACGYLGMLEAQLARFALGLVAMIMLAQVPPRIIRNAAPLAYVLGAPGARFGGTAGSLARQNAVRNPARTASTAAAVMIGLALITFVAVIDADVGINLPDFRASERSFQLLPGISSL